MSAQYWPAYVQMPNARQEAVEYANEIFGTKYTLKDAITQCRETELVAFRMHLCWFLHRKRGWEYSKIAHYLDRDHASIMHLVAKAEGREKKYPPRQAGRRQAGINCAERVDSVHGLSARARIAPDEIRSGL